MLKIAINGVKNVGKDFIFGKLTERLEALGHTAKRVSMADFLKETCIEERFFDWDHNGFLRRDFNLAKKSYPEYITGVEDFDTLSVEEKLQLVETFKNLSSKGFETRVSLQQFGDYYKKVSKNMFVFSDLVIEKLGTEGYKDVDFVINTDTRFITELLNFLLDDFLFIRLMHEELLEREMMVAPHVSELEVSLYPNPIGCEFNMIGTKFDPIAKVKRQNEAELSSSLDDIVKTVLEFKGYTKYQKAKLRSIKNELELDTDFVNATREYLKTYQSNPSSPEFENARKVFCDKRTDYLTRIDSIISQ